METSLTILYTGKIRGELDLLPRLYTFIRQLKIQFSGRMLLFDVGESCSREVWPCGVTGGRSTLIVLDAMGYDAANVSGFLTAEGRAKVGGMMQLALVDAEHGWETDTVAAVLQPATRKIRTGLQIILQPDTTTRLAGDVLYLAGVDGGQVGMAQVGFDDAAPVLQTAEIMALPTGTQPDPTIVGAIDLIVSEARYFDKKHSGG